jgi:homocysteine S-methyltransferase
MFNLILFVFQDGRHTARGENFQESVKKCWSLNSQQLVAVGCNCLNPKFVADLFTGINNDQLSPIPLIVYPNSGEQYTPETG